jgi:hypothetical protein
MLKFFDADPGIRDEKNSDPGWRKVGAGINIPDPQHCFPPIEQEIKKLGYKTGTETGMPTQ